MNYRSKLTGLSIQRSIALLIGLGFVLSPLPGDAVEFSLPGDAAPRNSSGGGSRGKVKFTLPGGSAPANSSGGGSRGDVNFALPGAPAPRSSSSGGSRTGEDELEQAGASRGLTPADSPSLTALLPESNLGLTIAARPKLYVYMPPLDTQQAFFSLKDESGTLQYEATLTVEPGIVTIQLPPESPELLLDQNYLWYFSPVENGAEIPPESYEVSGWIKRVEPSQAIPTITTGAITSSQALEQANRYANEGLWYDTLTMLETAQQGQPDDLTIRQEWQDLLIQVGLASVATQSFSQ